MDRSEIRGGALNDRQVMLGEEVDPGLRCATDLKQ
jgi:hypothetical protein